MNANSQDTAPENSLDRKVSDKSGNTKKKIKIDKHTYLEKQNFEWRNLIFDKLHRLSEKLGLPLADLQWWLEQLQLKYASASPKEFEWLVIELIHLAHTHHLDPLLGHVHAWQDTDNLWQVAISLDGLLALLNRQPQFDGLCINESPPELEHQLTWAECVIYRKDRAIPISHREYAVEVTQESDIWQKMPRRMLKNKALQQCARMAFGFGGLIITESVELKRNTSQNNEPRTEPSFKIAPRSEQINAGGQMERLKVHLLKTPDNSH